MPNLWFIIDEHLYMFDKTSRVFDTGVSFFRHFYRDMLWIVQFIYVVRSETDVQSVTAVLTENESLPRPFKNCPVQAKEKAGRTVDAPPPFVTPFL